jgi:hypothetical protein
VRALKAAREPALGPVACAPVTLNEPYVTLNEPYVTLNDYVTLNEVKGAMPDTTLALAHG